MPKNGLAEAVRDAILKRFPGALVTLDVTLGGTGFVDVRREEVAHSVEIFPDGRMGVSKLPSDYGSSCDSIQSTIDVVLEELADQGRGALPDGGEGSALLSLRAGGVLEDVEHPSNSS